MIGFVVRDKSLHYLTVKNNDVIIKIIKMILV